MKLLLFFILIPVTIYSQVFEVYDIDKSNFPSLSAKITSSYQNGTRILNQELSEFKLTENGLNRKLTSLKYSDDFSEKTSSVIILDLNNMNVPYRDYTKNVAKYWVESLSEGSECSILTINDTNHLELDFTEDKTILLSTIESIIRTNQKTKIENAFITPPNSGFQQIQRAKNERKNIIIFSNTYDVNIKVENIINSFNSLNTSIYFISMLDNYNDKIDSVCKGTNGQYFFLLSSELLIKKELNIILAKLEQSNALIEWDSEYNCSENVKVSIYNSQNKMTTESNYTKTEEMMARLKITPEFINFGELPKGSFKDTTINLYATNKDLNIQDFQVEYGSSVYTIRDALPISLMKGESIDLHLRYAPTDSIKSYTQLNIITDYCPNPLYLLGGYKYQDTIIEATTITSPIKNDYYIYKDEIVIKWTKVQNHDRYIVKFTSNNGSNWATLSDSVIGTSYTWNAPNANSDKCAFRVEPYIEPEKNILEVEWDKYIGISRKDISKKLIQTRDGGYIIVGSTLGQDSSSDHKLYSDILIIKTNSIGEQIWTRTYGGKEGDDFAYSVVEDNDNNLFVVGKTNSTDFGLTLNGGFDLLFMKLNPSGDIILKKNFGKEQEDAAVDIELSNDGNLFLGGFSNLEEIQERYSVGQYDYWLLKLNKSGEQIWSKYYGFDKNELITDIQLSINGGVILFGRSNSRDSVYMGDKYGTFKDKDHGWIVKVDNEGEMEWDFQYVHGRDEPYIITESAKGEIYVSGYTVFYHNSNNIKRNLWLLKLNELGEEVWIKRFSNQSDDVPVGIKINDNDEIFLFTFYFTNDGLFKRVYKLLSSNYTAYYKNFYYLNGSGSRGFCSTFDNGMAFIGTRTDIKKETPFNFNLVKISNEQLYDIGYSDLFEIASSKPHFTVDTISFPKVCEGELVDTVIIDMVCNDGVIPVEIQDFFFWLAEDEFKIDSVYGDNILEPGECMDMGFSFLSKDGHGKEYILYANYSFGRSADRVLLKGNVYLSKLSFSNSAFSFLNVIEKQKSDVKYLVIKNNSRSSIEVKIKKKNNNNFTINEGVDSFTIDAQKEIDIPIVFNPNSVDVFKMDFNLEFDGNKISDTIHLFGTSIKDINTNVPNYNMSSSSLDISPNPASEQLNIDITTGVQGTMKLELVATDGRVIYTDEWTQYTKSKQMQINTMNIPSGLYQVRLITPYDAITKSVIVVE